VKPIQEVKRLQFLLSLLKLKEEWKPKEAEVRTAMWLNPVDDRGLPRLQLPSIGFRHLNLPASFVFDVMKKEGFEGLYKLEGYTFAKELMEEARFEWNLQKSDAEIFETLVQRFREFYGEAYAAIAKGLDIAFKKGGQVTECVLFQALKCHFRFFQEVPSSSTSSSSSSSFHLFTE